MFKCYIADALTLLRAISAIVLVTEITNHAQPEVVLWTFVLGELTDAFDGIAARRWPFPEGKAPRYRNYAERYDKYTDIALGVAILAYLLICQHPGEGPLIALVIIGVASVLELIAYGRLFGTPTHHAKYCLYALDPAAADTIVLGRRGVYAALVGGCILQLILATAYPVAVKVVLMAIGAAVGIALIFIKLDRLRHNSSL